MPELFARQNLKIEDTPCNWRAAVEICGALLVGAGAAEPAYTAAMIQAVETLGPYIVVVPHIALAHAAPGPSVLRDETVMAVFRQPVLFGSGNDPVHIVIGMSAAGHDSHLAQFGKFARILEDEAVYRRILACEDEEELYRYINSIG